jgi:hypothetical protein
VKGKDKREPPLQSLKKRRSNVPEDQLILLADFLGKHLEVSFPRSFHREVNSQCLGVQSIDKMVSVDHRISPGS